MSEPARRRATYEDVLNAPEHQVAELIDGQLYLQPRPAPRHARSAGAIIGQLDGPFDRGAGGPGGWIILVEPELHLGENVLVPDVAGWRRSTVAELPDEAYFSVAPDWVAEVASPRTQRMDRTRVIVKCCGTASYLGGHLPVVSLFFLELDSIEETHAAANERKLLAAVKFPPPPLSHV